MAVIIATLILVFIVIYRKNEGEKVYLFLKSQYGKVYSIYEPYSYKTISKKVKELGRNYTLKQYITQTVIFGAVAAAISYVYFRSLFVTAIYVVAAIGFVPYLGYLTNKKAYSEFLFEQVQVYTTNVIMEYNTTKSFVKALEGVVQSGVLEDPILSDVKTMISLAYQNGAIDESIKYMNEKYDYQIVKNMHQLFYQLTTEGAHDTSGTLENMLSDIDMLVEGVYRDRMDRSNFHKQFLQYGIMLYFLVMLIQYMLGTETYISLLDMGIVKVLLHTVLILNSYFLYSGEKYYCENVGAE